MTAGCRQLPQQQAAAARAAATAATARRRPPGPTGWQESWSLPAAARLLLRQRQAWLRLLLKRRPLQAACSGWGTQGEIGFEAGAALCYSCMQASVGYQALQ